MMRELDYLVSVDCDPADDFSHYYWQAGLQNVYPIWSFARKPDIFSNYFTFSDTWYWRFDYFDPSDAEPYPFRTSEAKGYTPLDYRNIVLEELPDDDDFPFTDDESRGGPTELCLADYMNYIVEQPVTV